mmetsp:Transcript_155791/g.271056  ORF Transcript_155791/g.271056 Transcript_155791/m.271056 type:complete len:547 (+) Transcript_155791:67-1707(+)
MKMFCCKGSKTASKPAASRAAFTPVAAQPDVTGTLLSPKGGNAAYKDALPMKEAFPDSIMDSATPLGTVDSTPKPDTSEEQHMSQQMEVSSHGYSQPVGNDTASHAVLRKQRTVAVDKDELDVMVVEYSCHDSSVLNALGKHSKEAKWKVQVGYDVAPVNITLQVDKGVVSGPAVKLSSDGRVVFQTAGGYTRRAMYDDFEHRWPFRGKIRGMSEPNMFEIRPHAMASDQWFPATITGQREDGLFEVVAMMPDNFGGFKQESYPAVDKADLREASTGKLLKIPERFLSLRIPRDDPLQACLSLDGQDLVTHHFARPSPSLMLKSDAHSLKKQLELRVAKDRSKVTGNVGHAVLSHFVNGEVQAVSSDIQKLRHSWTIQVGPFAEHTVVVEKKHILSKILSLTVDGEPFVEASAEDIDCFSGGWECKFRFVGERIVDFEVHESNRDGVTLDSKDHVQQKKKYVHECCVTVGEDMDMRTATLTVDSEDFRDLPAHRQLHEEENISMSPEALRQTYGILVPYKVNQTASCGFFNGAPKTMRRVKNVCCC